MSETFGNVNGWFYFSDSVSLLHKIFLNLTTDEKITNCLLGNVAVGFAGGNSQRPRFWTSSCTQEGGKTCTL